MLHANLQPLKCHFERYKVQKVYDVRFEGRLLQMKEFAFLFGKQAVIALTKNGILFRASVYYITRKMYFYSIS